MTPIALSAPCFLPYQVGPFFIREELRKGQLVACQGNGTNHSQSNLKGGISLKTFDIIFVIVVVLIMVGMVIMGVKHNSSK